MVKNTIVTFPSNVEILDHIHIICEVQEDVWVTYEIEKGESRKIHEQFWESLRILGCILRDSPRIYPSHDATHFNDIR